VTTSVTETVERLVRALLVAHLGGTPAAEDAEALEWGRRWLGGDPALSAAEEQAAGTGAVSPRVRQELATAVAAQLSAAGAGGGAPLPPLKESTRARGNATMKDVRTEISNEGVHGPVKNEVRNVTRNTVVAVGGGAMLALVLAVIWWQWTSRQDSSGALDAFQGRAAVACEQIAATYTQLSVVLGDDPQGPADLSVSTTEAVAALEHRRDVVQSQVAALEAAETPASLVADRDAVVSAARAFVDATPAAAAAISGLGSTMTIGQMHALRDDPATKPLVVASSQLEDALAALSAAPCRFDPSTS